MEKNNKYKFIFIFILILESIKSKFDFLANADHTIDGKTGTYICPECKGEYKVIRKTKFQREKYLILRHTNYLQSIWRIVIMLSDGNKGKIKQFLNFFIGLFKALLLKIFPSLGYKGVVNTQIKIYKCLKNRGYADQDILNILLNSRRMLSQRDLGADNYYQELIDELNKNLEKVIIAIIDWEYFYNLDSYQLRGEKNIPIKFVEKFKEEMHEYVINALKQLKI